MMKPSEVMEKTFKGSQLRLARHYWGKTLQDVSDDLEKTRQYVSQMETGKINPRADDDVIENLASSLDVTPAFFFKEAGVSLSEEQAHFRKLATTKASMKHKVLARGSIFDEVVEFIDTKVRLPKVDFPDESGAETTEEIERAAERVRAYWGLGFGPISHMVRVAERAGAVVTFFEDASTEVDALSITSRRPVIVRNDAKQSPFRLRFDIAHEIGHLVLHEGLVTGDRKTEAEANRFASAFMMPRSTFLKVFPRRGTRIDWAGISELKMEFQASKAAILYRARSLGLLDENQYKGAIISMKNRGESIVESEDRFIQKEATEVIGAAMKILSEHHQIFHADLANLLGVTPKFLSQVLPRTEADGAKKVQEIPPVKLKIVR